MNNLRNDLIVAFQEGNFLQAVYDKSLSEHENGNDLTDELVRMHNDGLLDVVTAFKDLRNKPDAGYNFFITSSIFEKALPHLNSPVQPVMDCVLHLAKEAGQGMDEDTHFGPFIDFCVAEPSRPKESLKQIEASIDQWTDYIDNFII